MKNKEVLKLMDGFIKKIKEKLCDNIDLYNCDLIIIPRVVKTEEKEKTRQEPKKKFKLTSKKIKLNLIFILMLLKKKIFVYIIKKYQIRIKRILLKDWKDLENSLMRML